MCLLAERMLNLLVHMLRKECNFLKLNKKNIFR